MALNFSAWLYPSSSWQTDLLWQSKDLIRGIKAPAGVEEVQDYSCKLLVAKGYVAKEEFPSSKIIDGLEIHTYPDCSTHEDQY